jgi:hypothetical protein
MANQSKEPLEKRASGARFVDAVRWLWSWVWFSHLDKAEARFAGWVARLTLVLCVIGGLQAWSFMQSERAFVALAAINMQGGVQVGKPLTTSITFKNSGRSPATDVTVYFSSGVQLPETPAYSQNFRTIPPIVSGGISTMNFGTGVPLQESDAERLKTGKLEFYAWGYVSFRDHFSTIFGPTKVGFCAVFDWKANGTGFESCSNNLYDYER